MKVVMRRAEPQHGLAWWQHRFNDKVHITTKEEWQEHFENMGRKDRREGKTQNPYMSHTRAYAEWKKGYENK